MIREIERGFLGHYQRPFLRVEQIVQKPDAGSLELQQGDRKLVLTVGGDIDAAYQTLEELRNPASVCWTQVRELPDEGLLSLVDRLDRLGWLAEAETGGRIKVFQEADEIRGVIERGTEWLIQAGLCCEKDVETACSDRSYANALLRFGKLAATGTTSVAAAYLRSAPISLSNGETDVAGEALCLMLRRWRRTSPLALRIVSDLFKSAHARLISTKRRLSSDLSNSDLAIAEPREVGNQIWVALVLFVLSAFGRYRSIHREFVPSGNLAGPGLNVLTAAEIAAERVMMTLGASPLLGLLDRNAAVRRCMVGIHLHQYFITMRQMEALYTLLEHRLRQDLKQACTQYLLEEIGHEVHELDACRELGVGDDEVAKFTPLPFFAAYPEVLGAIAEVDPLAYCLAISVAEGLPGVGKPLVRSSAQQGISGSAHVYHQSIDERLDHELATRRLTQHIPWIESDAARQSIQRFLYTVELSQLCWHQLANYAEAEMLPIMPVIFGMSAQQVLNTFVARCPKEGVGSVTGAMH
jgi:hypothetical protein